LRMREYVKGLLGQVGRKNSWRLAEHAGHATPDRFQRLLARAVWDPAAVRDEVRDYVFEHHGAPDGVLIRAKAKLVDLVLGAGPAMMQGP
jgi:DDE superfamily endonuclease